ncbi:MAG TPA: hypothetical protein VML91_09510 [Burkholderiales bacterium]|nr:hypothetical protein [Burkholderiales bacterium]
MARRITATITVEGDAALLAAFRRRANELLDAEFGEPYRELHTTGRLDWRLKAAGVPYPPFVTASEELPDLVVEVQWEDEAGGTSGRSTIRGGCLARQSAGEAPETAGGFELRVGADGTLAIAVVCRRRRPGEWIGYAVTAAEHALFRAGAGVLEATDGVEGEWAERWTIAGEHVDYAELAPREPIDPGLLDALEALSSGFAAEWIWFDESPPEETAVERARYAAYGFKVNPANVRSAKLKTVLAESPGGGFALAATDPEARGIAALVARHWLHSQRH